MRRAAVSSARARRAAIRQRRLAGRRVVMAVHPVRWLAVQASTGVKDLPRNGAWTLSKLLAAPGGGAKSAGQVVADTARRASVAVAEALPGGTNSVEARLARAEEAVTRAKQSEQDALVQAREADSKAEAARTAAEEGKQRLREAQREAKQEVDRLAQEARRRLEEQVEREREQARQETDERVAAVDAEVRSQTEKLRADAEEAAERAQRSIALAHEQMADARRLAAEATQAAQEAAEQAHRQARAVAEKAQRNLGAADRVLDDARGTEQVLEGEAARAVRAERHFQAPPRLADRTKAELVTLAEPLQIPGAARMNKEQLVRSIQRASRAKAPSRAKARSQG